MTGVFQERMRGDHKTLAHTMMYGVNKWSTIILAIGNNQSVHFSLKFKMFFCFFLWDKIDLFFFIKKKKKKKKKKNNFNLGMVWSGEFVEFLVFVGRYPEVLWNMLLFSIASALGQVARGFFFLHKKV